MTGKTKIAFILPDLKTGGAEMVMMRLMNGIDRNKFEVSCIAILNKGALKDYIKPDVAYHNLGGIHLCLSAPKLYGTLRKIKPDIIISTMAHMNLTTLMLHPFFPKTRFVVRESTLPACTLHGRGPLGPIIKFFYKTLYPRAHRILAPAQIILDRMQAELHLSAKNMRMLANPVDENTLRAQAETTEATNTTRFIAAGRLHHEKGFDRLVDALKSWQGRDGWRLDILGDGPQKIFLEEMIKAHQLQDKVFLRGFQKNPAALVGQADAFLLPSRWEGSPNAALESLACGTPVIALKEAGGIIEIAASAPKGAVTLCNSLDEILKAMEKVKPIQQKRPSLLPAIYRHENVIRDFENMLQDLLQETP